ncbi:MAG TPA: hypothetical protein VGQ60_04145 [Nitrospiraceae bacterium]|nr:hypothetical protein [Nitrospiraceae bacterium]
MNDGQSPARDRRWRIWGGIAVVFLCGLLVGIVATNTYQEYQRTHRWEKGLAAIKPRAMNHLTRELSLSVEQQQQIEPILAQAESELLRLRIAQQPRVEKIVGKTKESLKPRLTPEQQTKLDELYGRLQQRWEKDRQYVRQLEAASAKSAPDRPQAPQK